LLALALVACGVPRTEEPPPHVLIILVDTLRADHTGLDGYERDTTPAIDALSREGTVFRAHFANAPWTKPSVASMLTGLLPPAHGSQWGDFERAAGGEVDLLAQGFDTLPELLRQAGWSTLCLMTNETLTPALGYDQGFEEFVQLPANLGGDVEALRAARNALDAAAGPTFVWCHLMAPHNYTLPPNYPRAFDTEYVTPIRPDQANGHTIRTRYGMHFREQAVDTYDDTVLFLDKHVAALVGYVLAEHPNTIVVLTSDHGEEFGEHGGYLHSRTLFNELLRVPMIVWGPGVARGETVERLTQSVDLMPTVLELVGLEAAPGQGHNLFDASRGDAEVYAEKRNGRAAKRALITREGKLIESKPGGPAGEKPPMEGPGRFRFFTDPVGADDADALTDLPAEELEDRRQRMELLWGLSRDLRGLITEGETTRARLSEEDLKVLRKLGYVE